MSDINQRIAALRTRIPGYDRFAVHCETRGPNLTQAWSLGIGHKPGQWVIFPISVRGDSIESVLDQAEAAAEATLAHMKATTTPPSTVLVPAL